MIKLTELVEEFKLTHLNTDVDYSEIEITSTAVNRPALQMAGYFDYFDSDRIQLLGHVEHTFIQTLPEHTILENANKIFSYKIPCLIVCRDNPVNSTLLSSASVYGVPIFLTDESTSDFMGEIIRWLKVELAPVVTRHGVLVDIYGEGVLIVGESGIGKSETALELIRRGHRLVADDAVEIKKVSAKTLIGTSPEVIRHFIEVRGVGIIDVRQMFGVESIKATQNIDLVIQLESWDINKEYERLGLIAEYINILGNDIVSHKIPIRPGRNLAVICEAAAINHRQKKMGYNAAEVLNQRISDKINLLQ